MRPTALLMSLALVAGLSADSLGQCCGQPTVAYSPVVAQPAPVVATTVNTGWYPGKYLGDFTRNLFGWGSTTTYTAGYAPYTAGYAPYTAGYAPYSVGYAPTYNVGYAPTYRAAYRPTYPATWGQVSYAPAVQTVSRPVVLSPVVSAPACNSCGGCGACDACSGSVEPAYYAGAPSSGCSSCDGGSNYVVPQGYDSYSEPQPSLAPEENPARERSLRPEIDGSINDNLDFDDDRTQGDPAAANEYWRAPPLFAPPSNRVTKNAHPAPVQTAVYRRPAGQSLTTFRPNFDDREREPQQKPSPKVHRLSADGWGSAAE